jgi:uncharacterized protein YggE
MVLIAVHGRAAVHLPAERGTVLLSVQREHEDRATAVEQVAARAASVTAQSTP